MRAKIILSSALAVALVAAASTGTMESFLRLCAAPAFAADTDWKKVDLVFGRSAAVTGAVHRYGLPRSDLKVTLDGVSIKPGFALGRWVAFDPMGDTSMMMGDLVLTESEINPVMTKLLAEACKSQPCITICCAPTPQPFICTSPERAILNNWRE